MTALRWDFISLPPSGIAAIAGTTMRFGRGDADASVYIGGAHHPVDINCVSFGRLEKGKIEAEFKVMLDFEHEGLAHYRATDWSFRTLLTWTDEAQTALRQ